MSIPLSLIRDVAIISLAFAAGWLLKGGRILPAYAAGGIIVLLIAAAAP
jgi:hypothetical protein